MDWATMFAPAMGEAVTDPDRLRAALELAAAEQEGDEQ